MYSTYIRIGQSTCIGNTYIHVQYIIIQVPYTELHVQKVIVIVTSLFMYLHVHVYLYNPNSMLSTGYFFLYNAHRILFAYDTFKLQPILLLNVQCNNLL